MQSMVKLWGGQQPLFNSKSQAISPHLWGPLLVIDGCSASKQSKEGRKPQRTRPKLQLSIAQKTTQVTHAFFGKKKMDLKHFFICSMKTGGKHNEFG